MTKHKILIIDDDEDILMLVKMALTMNHFEVETLARWEYVDDYVKRFSPELILLDISLKGADGRNICKKLKQDDLLKHIPVILFSANNELGNTFRECSAQDFVEKPYELPHLLKTIRYHLAGSTNAFENN